MALNRQLSLTFVTFSLALSAGATFAAVGAQAHPFPRAVVAEAPLVTRSHNLAPGRAPSSTNPSSRCAARRPRALSRRLLRRRLVTRACKTTPAPKPTPRRLPVPPPAPTPAPAPATPQTCTGVDLMPNPSDLDQVRSATLCLINNQRIQAGLQPLTLNPILQAVAQGKSDEMVAQDYFDHTNPAGLTASERVLDSGYVPAGASYAIGENIAFGTLDLGTPANIVTAWMNSPGHRANILDPDYRQTGMGVAPAVPASFSQGQPGGTYSEEFGSYN